MAQATYSTDTSTPTSNENNLPCGRVQFVVRRDCEVRITSYGLGQLEWNSRFKRFRVHCFVVLENWARDAGRKMIYQACSYDMQSFTFI